MHLSEQALAAARGVDLADLGVGQGPLDEKASRRAWHLLAEHWHAYAGTPSRYWMEHEFSEVFGLETVLNPRTADAMYDEIADRLTRPEFRPRALFDQFRIEVIATTDDPVDDLSPHDALAADAPRRERMARAARELAVEKHSWASALDAILAGVTLGRTATEVPA